MAMEKVKLQVIKYYELKNHIVWQRHE
jgi:hypothetical protein